MSEAKTKFAGGKSPFTGRSVGWVDPDKLELVKEPPPEGRAPQKHKYDKLFDKMLKTGLLAKVPSDQVATVQRALRSYGERNGLKGMAKGKKVHSDGMGRVWWHSFKV